MQDLSELFEQYLALNRGPGGGPPDYGVRATRRADNDVEIELTLTFKSGRVYCCGEPRCHFRPNWPRLRSLASELGTQLGEPLTIRLHGIVEAGSSFTSTVQVGGPLKNGAYEFDALFPEHTTDES